MRGRNVQGRTSINRNVASSHDDTMIIIRACADEGVNGEYYENIDLYAVTDHCCQHNSQPYTVALDADSVTNCCI